jgi:hypothetical protein
MHVVPTVLVQAGAELGALGGKVGLARDAAGCVICRGMLELDAVQPELGKHLCIREIGLNQTSHSAARDDRANQLGHTHHHGG